MCTYICISIDILGPLALPVPAHCCDRAFRCTRSVPPTFQTTLSSMWLSFCTLLVPGFAPGMGMGMGGDHILFNTKIQDSTAAVVEF